MNLNIFIITSTSFFSFPFILFRLSILLMPDARDLWDQNSEGQNFNLIPTIRGSLSKESSSLSSFPVNPVHSLLWWDRVNTNNIVGISSLLTLTYMRKASRFFFAPFSLLYSLFSVLCFLFNFCSVFLPHPLSPSPMSLLSLHHLFFIAYIDLRKNMYSLNQYRSLTSLVFRLTPEFVYTFFSILLFLFFSSFPIRVISPNWLDSTRFGSVRLSQSALVIRYSISGLPPFPLLI